MGNMNSGSFDEEDLLASLVAWQPAFTADFAQKGPHLSTAHHVLTRVQTSDPARRRRMKHVYRHMNQGTTVLAADLGPA